MLIDLSRAAGAYLHDIFLNNLDWGVLIGYVAQACSNIQKDQMGEVGSDSFSQT